MRLKGRQLDTKEEMFDPQSGALPDQTAKVQKRYDPGLYSDVPF